MTTYLPCDSTLPERYRRRAQEDLFGRAYRTRWCRNNASWTRLIQTPGWVRPDPLLRHFEHIENEKAAKQCGIDFTKLFSGWKQEDFERLYSNEPEITSPTTSENT